MYRIGDYICLTGSVYLNKFNHIQCFKSINLMIFDKFSKAIVTRLSVNEVNLHFDRFQMHKIVEFIQNAFNLFVLLLFWRISIHSLNLPWNLHLFTVSKIYCNIIMRFLPFAKKKMDCLYLEFECLNLLNHNWIL